MGGADPADILEAMEGLPPMYRAVFNLYAIEEYGLSGDCGGTRRRRSSKSNYAKACRNSREALRRKLRAQ